HCPLRALPYTPLFRSSTAAPSRTGQGATTQTASATTSAPIRAAFTRNDLNRIMGASSATGQCVDDVQAHGAQRGQGAHQQPDAQDRKSTRLNSSHVKI